MAAAKRKSRKSTSAKRGKRALKPKRKVGSRAMVMHGTAEKTSGGLGPGDLMYKGPKHNRRIVSRKRSALGKKAYRNNPTMKENKAPNFKKGNKKGKGGRKKK